MVEAHINALLRRIENDIANKGDVVKYLIPQDWQEFARLFPKAQKYLTERNLLREYKHLQHEDEYHSHTMNSWELARKTELENFFKGKKIDKLV